MIRSVFQVAKNMSKNAIFIQRLPCYNFCQNKPIYKPMMPLTQRYNAIFLHPLFSQCKVPKTYSIFAFWVPAMGVFVNNYLTQWNTWNSIAFVALMLAGSLLNFLTNTRLSYKVSCLQVDPQLKYIILTTKGSLYKTQLANKYKISNPQLNCITKTYHPFKQKHPSVKFSRKLQNFMSYQQNYNYVNKYIREVQVLETKIYRYKIPIQDVNFKIAIAKDQKPQFQRDKQRLSIKQLLRKYEDYKIYIQLQKIVYEIETEQNKNKRYHDYLLALALGYKIDVSSNTIFTEPYIDNQDQQTRQNIDRLAKQNQNNEQFQKLYNKLKPNPNDNKQKHKQGQKNKGNNDQNKS